AEDVRPRPIAVEAIRPVRDLALVGATSTVTASAPDHHHDHPHHDHDHGHDHMGVQILPEPSRSRPRLLALAVSGGILPSPTALVVLLAAIGAHRVGYGLALILSFSVGLAAALVAVALLALRAKDVVDRHLGERVGRVVPMCSALLIVGFG